MNNWSNFGEKNHSMQVQPKEKRYGKISIIVLYMSLLGLWIMLKKIPGRPVFVTAAFRVLFSKKEEAFTKRTDITSD